jgi:hypothetical protein
MKRLLLFTGTGLAAMALASAAWAPIYMEACKPGAPCTPPRPVGRCIKDEALRKRCTEGWDQCVVKAQKKGSNVCPEQWRTCCTGAHAITMRKAGGTQ